MIAPLNKTVIVLVASGLLAGCASNPDWKLLEDSKYGLQGAASHGVAAIGKRPVWVQSQEEAQQAAAQTRAILANKIISQDMAVRVAILNNKGLQADLAEIGISSAEMWQQTKLVNPVVSVGYATNPGARLVESAIVGNILSLITREKRVSIAEAQFRAAQHRAAEALLRLAFGTERAWIRTVASKETVTYISQAQTAADASSDLAKELGRTGAFNKKVQAREHAVFAEITGQLAEARINERSAREELNRLMGVWGNDINYKLPASLPKLPSKTLVKTAIEREALQKRVDLLIAKYELEAVARSHKLTNATRYLTDLEVMAGVEREKPKDGDPAEWEKRTELEFAIPIFDSGDARLRKAEFMYMQAANRLAEKAVNIRSEARGAYDKYKSTHELAWHYRQKVVPLRDIIKQEVLLEYNGMISSTFELLADTRAATNAMLMSVNAKRNFWLAEVDLRSAIHGGYGGGAAAEGGGVSLAEGSGGVH
jgi:outer membrane protein TolC